MILKGRYKKDLDQKKLFMDLIFLDAVSSLSYLPFLEASFWTYLHLHPYFLNVEKTREKDNFS